MEKISLRITTQANLFIGGTPTTFEISGVDLYTVTDYEGYPYIPASSFKGALRNIVRDMESSCNTNATNIKAAYVKYLSELQKENYENVRKHNLEQERIKRMEERFQEAIKKASAEYVFGIQGFNDTPKLIFGDFTLENKPKDSEKRKALFSVDSKNTISCSESNQEQKVSANPRTYKTVRPGVTFCGDIMYYNMNKLQINLAIVEELIEQAVQMLNSGIYRLGNSGSRGYGKVKVEMVRGCE